MRQSEEAIALRKRRDEAIRMKYDELYKEQKYSQEDIFHLLSEQFFLLRRQLQVIIFGK